MRHRLLPLFIFVLAPCVASCDREPAAPASTAIPTGTSGDPRGARLYVTNEMSGDLTVIDVESRREIQRIQLGKRPRGIRSSPDGSTLYVALSGSPLSPPGVDESTLPPPDRAADGIGVVDVREGRLLRVISAGSDPEQLAVSKNGRWLFVANEDAAQASVVSAADGKIAATIKVGGEPEGVDLRPDGRVVYVTSEEDHQVFVIDAIEPELIAKFGVGRRPRSTGFLPDGTRAYVANENSASLSVVDATTHRVIQTIQLGDQRLRPMGVVASHDGRHVFVTTGRGRQLVIVDAAAGETVGAIDVGERPWGVAVSTDGGTVFTANGPSNDVSFVDVASRSVTARVKVGERPWGLVYVE